MGDENFVYADRQACRITAVNQNVLAARNCDFIQRTIEGAFVFDEIDVFSRPVKRGRTAPGEFRLVAPTARN